MMPFYAPFRPFNPFFYRKANNYYPPYAASHNSNLNSNFNNEKPCFPSVSSKKEQDNFSCSKNSDTFFKNTCSFSKNDNNCNCSKDFDPGSFEIFGLKLGFDDLLIIAMLFLLYNEESNDFSLYLVLILLLLT